VKPHTRVGAVQCLALLRRGNEANCRGVGDVFQLGRTDSVKTRFRYGCSGAQV